MRLRKLYILVATVSVICITTLIYSVEYYNLAGFSDESDKRAQELKKEETTKGEQGYPASIAEIKEFIGGEWKVTYSRDRPEAVEQSVEARTGKESDYNPRLNIQEKAKAQISTPFDQRSKKKPEQLDSDGELQPIDDPETALVNNLRVVPKKGDVRRLRQQLARSRGSLDTFQFRNMSSQSSSLQALQKLKGQVAAKQQNHPGVIKPTGPTQSIHVLKQRVQQNEKAADAQVSESVADHSPDGARWSPSESEPRDQQGITETDQHTQDDEYDTRNDEAENRPVELVQLKRTAVGRNPSSIAQHQSNYREPEIVQPSSNPNSNFSVHPYLSMPLPQFTQPSILKSEWVQLLKEYLGTLKSKQISIVTATLEHEVVLLNWLISALVVVNPPLENVLVLSLSESLANLLKSKGIPVILVEPSTVIRDSARSLIRTAFSEVHIVRLSLFRLINHWGFDVVMYDGDAIPLKNPQPLFDSYPGVELIGSAGRGPDKVFTHWGRTICTGVLLMRASEQMELYWEKMARIARHPFTDQGLINLALKALGVSWDKQKPIPFSSVMQGECTKGDAHVRAVILSEEVICRYSCEEQRRSQYYVWHKPAIKRDRTVEKKMERAQDGRVWFLRSDWRARDRFSGVEWLKEISENV